MTLTREAILAADDLKRETVTVPEWGGAVIVRGLTAFERDQYEADMLDQSRGPEKTKLDLANARAELVVRSVVDSNDKRLFADSDANELGKKSAAAVDRVFDVAQRLSGMSDEDVEELVKDFGTARADALSSDSPSH